MYKQTKFGDKRLSMHHVGGRGGGRVFPFLKKFEADIVNVLYDADTDCLTQIRERNQHIGSQFHVLPYCLGDARKTAVLNINYDPYTSSLCEINPDYGSYYLFHFDHDYVWSESAKIMERRQVEVNSMDHVLQAADVQIPPPDFLSLDTQGSEYEILLGAKDTLAFSIVALVIEAEFHPLYKGQKLFGDLVQLLGDSGFHFVRFLNIDEMSPFRGNVETRGESFQVAADALFLRRIDNIDEITDPVRRYVMYHKLAFIAIVFNQFEFGLDCLRRCRDSAINDSVSKELEQAVYYRFLRELKEKIDKMPTFFPETFASKFTFEASRSRFEAQGNSLRSLFRDRIRVIYILRQFPALYLLLRRLKHAYLKMKKAGTFLKSLSKRHSAIESLLIGYGLREQAKILRANRIVQSRSSTLRCDYSMFPSINKPKFLSVIPVGSPRHSEQSKIRAGIL
jgi:FkbM family methyltransferase